LAKLSPVYKLYKGYLNTQVLNIYGAETPGRLRKDLKTDIAYAKDDRPETIDIQMALATFTEEIEVENEQIAMSETKHEPTKKVLFIVPPESFLLTPETKEKMTQGVPVDQLVKVIQEKFEFMSIQMKNSLSKYRKWRWFFLLSSPEVMNVHKKLIWGVSFAINILLGLRNSTTLASLSEGLLAGMNPVQVAIDALAIANAVYSFLQLVTWTLNKYTEVVETVALEYQMAESEDPDDDQQKEVLAHENGHYDRRVCPVALRHQRLASDVHSAGSVQSPRCVHQRLLLHPKLMDGHSSRKQCQANGRFYQRQLGQNADDISPDSLRDLLDGVHRSRGGRSQEVRDNLGLLYSGSGVQPRRRGLRWQ
jgi:hypothetical protein